MDIKKTYSSPRWTNEIADCSMPMTFDTYSKCSYNCMYCFSFFQKSHVLNGYLGGNVRAVNPERVRNLFDHALKNDEEGMTRTELQFFPYIQDRRIMQWGGLADEFDEWERKYGLTLELLRYFDSIDYPLSFSTKATWWTEDERYMELFRKHTHNWHVKISIITYNEERARRIEKGVPTPKERLKAMKRLTDGGTHVTLRLRPYILGVSDDYRRLISAAHEAGADSVTTEFFCLESRADERLKARYKEISDVIGFDIHKYYLDNSYQSGYKRLSKRIKRPIIADMEEYTKSLGMRFVSSDGHCRDFCSSCNCCGVPPGWGVDQKGHIGQAILIAKEKGEVHWSDIGESIEKYFGFRWSDTASYNTGSNKNRALRFNQTMAEFLRNNWNEPNKGTSPAKGYGGVLKPVGKDENGDIVYRYNDGTEARRRQTEETHRPKNV